jgi:hypothetical protein
VHSESRSGRIKHRLKGLDIRLGELLPRHHANPGAEFGDLRSDSFDHPEIIENNLFAENGSGRVKVEVGHFGHLNWIDVLNRLGFSGSS